MTTAVFTHPACLDHDMGGGHPECPDRLRAIEAALSGANFVALKRLEAPIGALDRVALCHTDHHIDELRHLAPARGHAFVDPDTAMSPGTWEAALRGVGGAVAAIDLVMRREAKNAFVATRPPGHHAEHDRAMGFCFFNHAAIAARHAQRQHGADRVAVVDFDVHHGNGTQDIFWADASVMYASTHQMPLFPGTGHLSERGEHGTIVNAPLADGMGSREFRAAFDDLIIPELMAFAPDVLVISAGFDAHYRDPLATLQLRTEDFVWATRKLLVLPSTEGRVISILEGGYDLTALQECTAAHVGVLMDA